MQTYNTSDFGFIGFTASTCHTQFRATNNLHKSVDRNPQMDFKALLPCSISTADIRLSQYEDSCLTPKLNTEGKVVVPSQNKHETARTF